MFHKESEEKVKAVGEIISSFFTIEKEYVTVMKQREIEDRDGKKRKRTKVHSSFGTSKKELLFFWILVRAYFSIFFQFLQLVIVPFQMINKSHNATLYLPHIKFNYPPISYSFLMLSFLMIS